jgi:hypothetical protein
MTHITPERIDELWKQAFDNTEAGGKTSHRFAALLFAEAEPVQEPVTERYRVIGPMGDEYWINHKPMSKCKILEVQPLYTAAQPTTEKSSEVQPAAQQEPIGRTDQQIVDTLTPSKHERVRELECVIADLKAECQSLRAEQPAPVQPVGDDWTPCVKLPVVVHVRQQRPGESHISTREGITPVKPDDLIMRGVSGEEYPIGRAIFEQTYTLDITPPAAPVPDAITDNSESVEYRSGFNECRELTIQMRKK